MQFLNEGKYPDALRELKAAEKVLQASGDIIVDGDKLHSLTMNNLGCYYKK